MRAHQRHRHHRHHGPPSELLRDARQLLLRRVLQRGNVRLGLRFLRERAGAAAGALVLHGVRGRRRDHRDLEEPGRARGPHLAPRRGRQLLARRPHRPLRPLLGDLLRPGPRVRLRQPRLRAGLRLRPVPRVLELRVHPVRRPGGRHLGAPSQEEHRHGHGARAHGRHHAGRAVQLRDRRAAQPGGRGRAAGRRDLRRGRRDRPGPAHHRRPLPLGHLHDRRRHPAGQRGPRLRAPPPAAPCHHEGPAHRHRGALPQRVRGRDRAAHGRCVPRDRGEPRA